MILAPFGITSIVTRSKIFVEVLTASNRRKNCTVPSVARRGTRSVQNAAPVQVHLYLHLSHLFPIQSGHNSDFRKVIDQWQIVYDLDALMCALNRRNRELRRRYLRDRKAKMAEAPTTMLKMKNHLFRNMAIPQPLRVIICQILSVALILSLSCSPILSSCHKQRLCTIGKLKNPAEAHIISEAVSWSITLTVNCSKTLPHSPIETRRIISCSCPTR